ncbi:protein of unknown function [Paraburkholderia dioscoreae]|uniref:Uncharacterized protein n=1 Tax=Paraburkholderia dioscoreae TaxID=2604047 RepID=A0A5Q4ZD76_9BURK|nr:protein of unknown function [Paraburkholderia dioscoreae]
MRARRSEPEVQADKKGSSLQAALLFERLWFAISSPEALVHPQPLIDRPLDMTGLVKAENHR